MVLTTPQLARGVACLLSPSVDLHPKRSSISFVITCTPSVFYWQLFGFLFAGESTKSFLTPGLIQTGFISRTTNSRRLNPTRKWKVLHDCGFFRRSGLSVSKYSLAAPQVWVFRAVCLDCILARPSDSFGSYVLNAQPPQKSLESCFKP